VEDERLCGMGGSGAARREAETVGRWEEYGYEGMGEIYDVSTGGEA